MQRWWISSLTHVERLRPETSALEPSLGLAFGCGVRSQSLRRVKTRIFQIKAGLDLTLSGEGCCVYPDQAPEGVEEWSARVSCNNRFV